MGYYEINRAVDDLVRIFREKGYTNKTITEHRRNIQRVVNLHHVYKTQYYDPQVVEQYVADLRENYKSGMISRSRKNALVKAALYVQEIATTGTVTAGAIVVPDKLSPHYRMILEKIRNAGSWSEGLKRNIIYTAHTYFRFPADSKIQDISSITEKTIRCYIMQVGLRFTSSHNLTKSEGQETISLFLILVIWQHFFEGRKNKNDESLPKYLFPLLFLNVICYNVYESGGNMTTEQLTKETQKPNNFVDKKVINDENWSIECSPFRDAV